MGLFQEGIQKGFGVFGAAESGIKNAIRPIFIYAYPDEIRGSDLSDLFMNGIVAIREQRKGDVVVLFKMGHLVGGIADTNSD